MAKRKISNDALERARDTIAAQVIERDRAFQEEAPAFPWDRCAKFLSYVFSLPAEHLRSIRLHCDLFLGENTPVQFFSTPDPNRVALYEWLGEGVNPARWASEPVIPILGAAMGERVGNKFVNNTTLVLQRYACNLERLGLNDGNHVVEIGAGYGGLAEVILRTRSVRYTIIDIPEMLIFAAAFLLHHFPERRAYVYCPGDSPAAMEGAELVFLPNYRADWLRALPPSQFGINTVSFPEMSRKALCTYRDLLADTLDGLLMSVNYFGERADGFGVPHFLAQRFALTPTPDEIIAGMQISKASYRDVNFRATMLCLPEDYNRFRLDGITLHDVCYSTPAAIRFTRDGTSVAPFVL